MDHSCIWHIIYAQVLLYLHACWNTYTCFFIFDEGNTYKHVNPWRESSKQHVLWYITLYVIWNFSFPIRASSSLCRKLIFGSNFQLAIDRHVRKDNDFSPWTGEDAHGSSILKHPSIKIIFSLFYLFLSSMWYEINKKTSNSMLFAKATFI